MQNHSRHASSWSYPPANSSQRLAVITSQSASKKTNQITPAAISAITAAAASVIAVPVGDGNRLRCAHSRARTCHGRCARWRCGGSTIFCCPGAGAAGGGWTGISAIAAAPYTSCAVTRALNTFITIEIANEMIMYVMMITKNISSACPALFCTIVAIRNRSSNSTA